MTVAEHNAGGKVFLRLDDRYEGTALFAGPGDCYRLVLTRQWSGRRIAGGLPPNFALWIGLNPSTATADHNDPTINREIGFSIDWGFDGLVKVNLMDWRATKPADLLAQNVIARSSGNLAMIRSMAREAKQIICAWGNVHRYFVPFAVETEQCLRDDGHELWALGKNAGGSPKHPLYVKGDTLLERFKEVPF